MKAHFFMMVVYLLLVCCFELLEEARVVFREHTEVADTVLQVGDALDTHTEGVAAIDGAVDAAGFEHVRVNHSATEDFHPAGVLAEAAAFTAADVTADVHLGAGFCEREVAGTQTDFRIGAEHLTGKGEEHLLQVGERYVLIDIQAFYLMEEAVGTGADGLVAIDASRTEDAERRLVGFHIVCLVAAGV